MIAAFIDHLWQSSLFALFAWFVTSLLSDNGAHLRYRIWFAASVKFLLPFSLLITAGEQLPWHNLPTITPIVEHASITDAIRQAGALLIAPAAIFTRVDTTQHSFLLIALMVWAAGCAVLMARWLVQWLAIRNAVRLATRTATVNSVQVMTTSMLREPGVVGIIRPLLLLPLNIAEHLTSEQLQSIIDHEMCHIRRRDNLTAAAHMLVESIFWFHPLVWWIGARLIDERERACDEAVLSSGNEPQTYAEAILKVCQFYLASKLTCVAGVSGADLKTRLESIMRNAVTKELSNVKKYALGMIALATFATPVVVGVTAIPALAHATDATTSATASRSIGKIDLIDGKRVKLNYENVELRSLLKALAEAVHVNMLVSDKVSGTVTVRLEEMPWDQALNIVLDSQGLTRHEKDGIIFVEPTGA